MNLREYPRVSIEGLSVIISAGKGVYSGRINDISQFGMSISELPEQFDHDSKIFSVTIEGGGRYFRLLLKQRWEIKSGENQTIGTEIQNSSRQWNEFVMQCQLRQLTVADTVAEQNLAVATQPVQA